MASPPDLLPAPPTSEADGDSTALRDPPTDALADHIAALERAVGIRSASSSGSTPASSASIVSSASGLPATGKTLHGCFIYQLGTTIDIILLAPGLETVYWVWDPCGLRCCSPIFCKTSVY